jgi:hypothetical protein
MNGSKETPEYSDFAGMSGRVLNAAQTIDPSSENPALSRPGVASSFHPGGVNVAFVSSQVTFMSDQIDPFVYAQLMTSNHKKSGLSGDMNAPEPADGTY